MMIKKLSLMVAILVFTGMNTQLAADEVTSLRGSTELDQGAKAPPTKKYNKDEEPIARDYIQQPPLIPHAIAKYRINLKSNKCLSCHSWKNYRQNGATKISQTHFEDREEHVLANVSARRYFCTQCHVPQVDAKPLVENNFKPITAITGE